MGESLDNFLGGNTVRRTSATHPLFLLFLNYEINSAQGGGIVLKMKKHDSGIKAEFSHVC